MRPKALFKVTNRLALERDCLVGPLGRPRIQNFDVERSKRKWNQSYQITSSIPNLRFIHIGKCGGTTIMAEFLTKGIFLEEDHLYLPRACPGWVFIWVRHPMSRFVSAFNHAKTILDFDTTGLDPNELTLENCPAPEKIGRRMTQGFAFTPEFDALMGHFENANSLAESLSSRNQSLARQAETLFAHPQEHIAKGLGFYLSNGKWVQKNKRRILMVGCLESMTQDFRRLADILGWRNAEGTSPSHRRAGSKDYKTDLSALATRNLASRFQQTEYPALRALAANGHLTPERLADYVQ